MTDFSQYGDDDLIRLIVNDPAGADGEAAREVLEYRKYLATKRYNKWLLWLTIILTISALGEVVLETIKILIGK